MSELAAPASKRLHESLDVPLTLSERWRIVVQLGTAMVAASLLAAGWLQVQYGPPEMANLGHLVIAVAACIVAAPIFLEALRGLFSADPHTVTEQLVALATLAAMMTGDFVTATLIPVIMHIGHFLEERSVLGAQAAIEGLRQLHAGAAHRVTEDGSEEDVDAEDLHAGDILVLRPGDIVAADGEVLEGSSAIDQSSVTGESVPEDVALGSPVYAGSVNLSGLLRVKVTRTGSQTALGRVVDLLRDAEQSKTPVLKLIEQYAGYYVPILLIVAALVLFVTREMSRTVAVLVVGCPGALILAGPTAMVAALAVASRLGILIKNTRFLESLADVDTVVLDKTGTVTLGHLELVGIHAPDARDKTEILHQAARCASASRHPASRAIVTAAGGGNAEGLDQIEEVPGKGIRAQAGDEILLLGRREWLEEFGLDMPENPEHAGPIVWLGRGNTSGGGEAVGCFQLADVARPEAKEALAELKRLGLSRSVLLTGDREAVAKQIGEALDFDEIISEVLPEQKLEVVRCENEDRSVMMVGDGVNDALALAGGDVGVALGAVASDVALQSADVALMTNDLGRLPMTVELARRTRATIHQNILIGAALSIVFVWAASAGHISPLMGAALHNVGELFVIANSARLLGFVKTE